MKTQQTLSPVYIMGGLRTPIGSYKGQFKTIKPEILGARVLDALYAQYPKADEIICGNAVGTGGNIGRLTAMYSRYGEKRRPIRWICNVPRPVLLLFKGTGLFAAIWPIV